MQDRFFLFIQHPYFRFGCVGLLALLLLWQVASLFFFSKTINTASKTFAKNTQQNQQQYKNIALYNPTAPSAAATSEKKVVNAPKTNLKLKLVGLMYSPQAQLSRAIIEERNDGGSSYKVNDKIAGNAKIYSIENDRVVLLRNGRHESLFLEEQLKVKVAGANNQAAIKTPVRTPRAPIKTNAIPPTPTEEQQITVRKSTGRYWQQVSSSVSNLNSHFLATPVKDENGIKGFTLRALKRRGLLAELGLHSADVITEVNGKALNNPLNLVSLYSGLSDAKNVNLTVERNGTPFNVSINLAP